MKPKVLIFLLDIKIAASSIKDYTAGITKFEDFISKKIVLRAVEKELEIISEAIKKIETENYSLNVSSKNKIIGLRNRIVHDYANTDYEIIWGVVYNHIDKLISEIEIEISEFE
jgi:uncharacterized protein with HEPN domain